MMHDAIAEIRGEYLAFDRFVDDKTNASADFISVIDDFIVKLKQFCFVINFKSQGVNG